MRGGYATTPGVHANASVPSVDSASPKTSFFKSSSAAGLDPCLGLGVIEVDSAYIDALKTAWRIDWVNIKRMAFAHRPFCQLSKLGPKVGDLYAGNNGSSLCMITAVTDTTVEIKTLFAPDLTEIENEVIEMSVQAFDSAEFSENNAPVREWMWEKPL